MLQPDSCYHAFPEPIWLEEDEPSQGSTQDDRFLKPLMASVVKVDASSGLEYVSVW